MLRNVLFRSGLAVGMATASGVVAVAALLWLVYALYLSVQTLMTPPLAALAVAGALLVVAGLGLWTAYAILSPPRLSRKRRSHTATVHPAVAAALDLLVSHPGKAAAIAVGVGLVAAINPRTRQTLLNILLR